LPPLRPISAKYSETALLIAIPFILSRFKKA
jgi:hypothetical protein